MSAVSRGGLGVRIWELVFDERPHLGGRREDELGWGLENCVNVVLVYGGLAD